MPAPRPPYAEIPYPAAHSAPVNARAPSAACRNPKFAAHPAPANARPRPPYAESPNPAAHPASANARVPSPARRNGLRGPRCAPAFPNLYKFLIRKAENGRTASADYFVTLHHTFTVHIIKGTSIN